MTVVGVGTRVIGVGDDLLAAIVAAVPTVAEGSILVVASKVVSFAERRLVPDSGSDEQLYALVRREADRFIEPHHSKYAIMLTIKGSWMFANAGIDRSNANGHLALWPVDPQASCVALWRGLKERWRLRRLGLILADSGGIPLSWGVVSRCIAHCGFEALRSYVGHEDLFGRPLQMERANLAQGLAAAAGVVMGEGAEGVPLAVLGDVEVVTFQDREPTDDELAALRISIEDDVYAPVLESAPWQQRQAE
jgi:coenzyme F420-0:L-glutamate ligase/coenzyme F420-1:gamma-L-glutamate ligase